MEKIQDQLNKIELVERSIIEKDLETLRNVAKKINQLQDFTFAEKLIAAHACDLYARHLQNV